MMFGINIGQPAVLIASIAAVLSLGFALAGWQMRLKLARATSDIAQLRQVVQDLISIQEYRLAKLKAEMGTPQPAPACKPTPEKPPISEVAERKRHIWSLAQKGLSSEEIARRMSLPYGQVEVLLNMRSLSDGINA